MGRKIEKKQHRKNEVYRLHWKRVWRGIFQPISGAVAQKKPMGEGGKLNTHAKGGGGVGGKKSSKLRQKREHNFSRGIPEEEET